MSRVSDTLPRFGTLRNITLAELLAHVHRECESGTLELRSPDERSALVVFAGGKLVKVRAEPDSRFLGDVLYQLGHIDSDQLNAALRELVASKRLLGEVLCERGAIDRKQLRDGLRHQAARKLAALFAYPPQTSYVWTADADALEDYGGADWPASDLRPIVWHGVRKHAASTFADRVLKRARDRRFALSASTNLGRFDFDERERAVAEHMRAKSATIEELCEADFVEARRAELVFACLLVFGELEGEEEPAAHSAPTRRPSGLAPTVPPWAIDVRRESGVRAASTPQSDAAREEANAKFSHALALVERGDFARALSACREACAARPDDVEYRALATWLDQKKAAGA